MRKHATIIVRIFAILGILAGIYSQCTGQIPIAETNAVTLNQQVIHKVTSEVDPLSRRMTLQYEAITERSDWSLGKSFIRAIVPTIYAGGTAYIGAMNQVDLLKGESLLRQHPNLNRQYFDRRISWQNKKLLWAARDFYHDSYKVHAWGMGAVGASIAVPLVHNWSSQKKWQTAIDAAVMLLCSAGSYICVSHITYNAY